MSDEDLLYDRFGSLPAWAQRTVVYRAALRVLPLFRLPNDQVDPDLVRTILDAESVLMAAEDGVGAVMIPDSGGPMDARLAVCQAAVSRARIEHAGDPAARERFEAAESAVVAVRVALLVADGHVLTVVTDSGDDTKTQEPATAEQASSAALQSAVAAASRVGASLSFRGFVNHDIEWLRAFRAHEVPPLTELGGQPPLFPGTHRPGWYVEGRGWLSGVLQDAASAASITDGRLDAVVVWDPALVSDEEYAELIEAFGDVVRSEGGGGVQRVRDLGYEVPAREGVPQ